MDTAPAMMGELASASGQQRSLAYLASMKYDPQVIPQIAQLEVVTCLARTASPRIFCETKNNDLLISLALMLTNGIQEFAASHGTAVDYLYLNCADKDQDPLFAYEANNVKFMKKVAKKYDSSGAF